MEHYLKIVHGAVTVTLLGGLGYWTSRASVGFGGRCRAEES